MFNNDDDLVDPLLVAEDDEPGTDPIAQPTSEDLDEIGVDVLPRPERDPLWLRDASFQMPPNPPVPGLFTRCSINLLIGPTFVGKTVLALTQLDHYTATGQFLGYQLPQGASPDACAAIVATQGLSSFHGLLRSLRLPAITSPVKFPIEEWEMRTSETMTEGLVRLWKKMSRLAQQPIRLLYVEGFQNLLENGKLNDPRSVQEFYTKLRQFCAEYRVTILGSVPQGKMRKGESYALVGERVYGSVAWANEADTVIGMEQLMVHLPVELRPSFRKITIQVRGVGTEIRWVDFNDRGRLEVIDRAKELATENPTFAMLDRILGQALPGSEWSREELFEWAERTDVDVSMRSMERWIASRCDTSLSLLVKVGTGPRNRRYKKPFTN
jgi:hypothetical protein